MAKAANSNATGTASSVLSAEPPKQDHPKQDHQGASAASARPKPPTKRQHRELLALAAFGSTFGFLTGWGLWTEIHYDSVEFVLMVVVLALAGYVFIDPLSELVKEGGDEERGEGKDRRGVAAGVFGAAGVLTVAAMDHSLTTALGEALGKLANELTKSGADQPVLHTLARDTEKLSAMVLSKGPLLTALIMLAIVGVSSLLITALWAHGARRHPVRSAHFGGSMGFALGICAASFLAFYLIRRDWVHGLTPWFLASLALLWFVVPGLLGGWAIHKLEADASPTRQIAWYLVVSSAVNIAAVLAFARWVQGSSSPYKESINGLIWLPVCALLFQNLGWALVPYYRRKNCDVPLRPLEKIAEQPSHELAHPTLVEMPRREGVVPIIIPDPRQVPQEMILKPKGDRLWATVGLVLALIIATPLYLLGTLRSDRSIASGVEGNLQQDSGLRTKGLAVHSAGRVVIISGAVHNETERTEAIQRALSVRGVKQLIDQIQVVPPQPTAPPTPAVVDPSPETAPPQPSINATISIGGAAGNGKAAAIANGPANGTSAKARSSGSQKPAAIAKPQGSQKSVEAAKTAEAPKHKGLLNFLKRDKNNLGTAADAKKPADTPKAADAEKHKGLFNFLKKDKDKNKTPNKNVIPAPKNNNVIPVPNNQNVAPVPKNNAPPIPNNKSNKNPKKEVNKNPAVH